MRELDLRRLDRLSHQQQQQIGRWQRQGLAASVGCPPVDAHYLMLSGQGPQGRWCVLLDAEHWLQQRLPQLATLLPPAELAPTALNLCRLMPRPLEADVAELAYNTPPQVTQLAGADLAGAVLVCLVTNAGLLWVQALQLAAPPRGEMINPRLAQLPLCVSLTLGHSVIESARLARIAPGDLLIIRTRAQGVYLTNRRIGHFTLTPQGLVMNLDNPADEAPVTPPLADAEVALQFVLHERTMSLAQLNALEADAVMELPADTVQRVRVTANGTALAVGELVQLEDGLGVVLHTLLRGPLDE